MFGLSTTLHHIASKLFFCSAIHGDDQFQIAGVHFTAFHLMLQISEMYLTTVSINIKFPCVRHFRSVWGAGLLVLEGTTNCCSFPRDLPQTRE